MTTKTSTAVLAKNKAWDCQLACLMITPLQNTWVSPNHITTLSLLSGLASGWCYAQGSPWTNWGALLFILCKILDHADGELARLTGRTSKFGHYYDYATDFITFIALFTGIGLGLDASVLDGYAPWLGAIAGFSICLIFILRLAIENRLGKTATAQSTFAGFETEDVLYLIGPITWFGGLVSFLKAAAIGAPIFALWVVWDYRRSYARHKSKQI